MHLTANMRPVSLSWARTTSEKAPLWGQRHPSFTSRSITLECNVCRRPPAPPVSCAEENLVPTEKWFETGPGDIAFLLEQVPHTYKLHVFLWPPQKRRLNEAWGGAELSTQTFSIIWSFPAQSGHGSMFFYPLMVQANTPAQPPAVENILMLSPAPPLKAPEPQTLFVLHRCL